MRLDRSFFILLRVWLLAVAAGALHGQVLVSLGAGSGCGALQAAQTCTLTARVTGATNLAVTWSFSPAVAGAVIGTGSAPDSTGLSTNTYKAPNFISTAQTVTATATSVADPTQAASVSISLVPVIIVVVVSPSSATLSAGETQQFSAKVSGISQTGVTWSISPQVGSIDPASGLYTAPATISASQKVTVTAASVFEPTATGTATVTLLAPAITVTVSPASVTLGTGQTQQFTAALTNATSGVTWSINPQVGTIDNTGLYTAPATIATNPTKVTVTATSVDDPTKSGTASVTLQAATAISVTVTPATVTLNNNQTQQFTATVANSTAGVTWSISPQVGTISTTGVYTAPGLISTTQKVTVTAASIADSSKTGTATVTLATAVDVGLGAPGALVEQFVQAYYRNGFNLLVTLPPLGNVKKLGTTGYVQEFSDAQTSGLKDALATVSATVNTSGNGAPAVVQLMGNLYTYYSSVGAGTAGYPLMDSQTISGFDPSNNCEYDLFDAGYALFAYAVALATGQNFSISAGFYTEWTKDGGIAGLGRPVDVQTAITAAIVPPATAGTTATVQTFANGAIYTINSGPNKSKVFSVVEPIWDLYQAQSGPSGTLGLPTSELLQVSSTGVYSQSFEGGALQYTPGSGGPTLELPVSAVSLIGAPASGAVTLNLGQTLSLSALPVASNGANLADRPVAWSTTNGKVVSIQATGQAAVLTAVGGGTANVTASSGGVTSPKLTVTVIAPCCQIGDGAPASVAQAFQAAIARNKLSIAVPVPSVAARVGNGYAQMVQSSDPNSPASYMLAQADQAGTAYVVGSLVLARYLSLGGPAGALGYPISDQTAGGTQLFAANAALAGNPVRLVSGGVLAKWALLGYETGPPGPPTAEAASFSTLGANSGSMQTFGFGAVYDATAGPLAGQAYYVAGLILIRYNALGGAAGNYGMPVSDEFVTGTLHQQNFEGGNIAYSAGDTAAVDHPAPKVPAVVVAPASISAGGRALLAITGFPNNSTIRVSQTGQPDFLVTTANGAYAWDMTVPLTAKSSTVGIHAADTGSSASASGSLAIKGFSGNLAIAKVQGDNQTGLPGAMLPLSLKIALLDSSGNPVMGAPVVFQASAGAQLSIASALTDSTGAAATFVRLPATQGVTAVTANVPSIAQAPVTFYARAAAAGLSNFPQLVEAGNTRLGNGTATIAQKGALLTAVASILEYHQNRSDLPAPNGTADPVTLNQFLLSDCTVNPLGSALCDGFLSNPDSGEQIVNLWRAADFTSGVNVTVENPTVQEIADLLAQGSPALLSLGLSLNGTLAGGHFVVAIGVAADGSIVIQDPSPLFARSNLNDYLTGFTAAGGTWTAALRGVVQFALGNPSAKRFMLAALSQPPALMQSLALNVASAAGACGLSVDLLDAVDSSGNGAGGLTSRIDVCDGLDPAYQVTVGAAQPYHAFVTDLASGGSSVDVSGSAPATYLATRPQLALTLAAQTVSFTANAVVNAATFTSGIAPGGIFSIFGTGLSGAASATSVNFDGAAATVLFATPFQINAVVPPGTAPGTHTLHVVSAFGSAQQTVTVSPVAPAIFLVGSPQVGAVENQDGSLNGSSNPLPRGQVLVVYATGLGAVAKQGQLSVTTTPVTVMLNGQPLPTAFAGLAPGTTGEYQVNVTIPATTPPGLAVPLALQQGGQVSNTVLVALQ